MSDSNDNNRLEQAMETIDVSKRSAMRKLVVGAAFAAPVVASFAIDGMLITSAQAGQSTNSTVPPPP